MTAETWRTVPGWEGLYEVSDEGLVRSLPRVLTIRNGRTMTKPGVVLRGRVHRGYLMVKLARNGKWREWPVHQIVTAAFLGPRPDGIVTRHLDGNPLNNAITNLAYGTQAENVQDSVIHGTHKDARKTHCPQGHAYSADNTRIHAKDGSRDCKTCSRERQRTVRERLRAA